MRHALVLALSLAACNTPSPEAPTETASGERAPATEQAQVGRMPASLLGTYDADAAACDETTTMSRLSILPDTLDFYYGYAIVDGVEARGGGYDVSATLYHLEGAVEVVPTPATYRAESTRGGLRFSSAYGGAEEFARCSVQGGSPKNGAGIEPTGNARGDVRSRYTQIATCETVESFEESGGSVQRCPGYGGTPLFVSEGDLRYDVDAGVRNDDFSTPAGFNALGKTVEWRIRDGRPFAVIVRYTVDGPGGTPEERRSDLAVIKVGREGAPGCLVGYVPAGASPDQNTAARQLADREATGFACDG